MAGRAHLADGRHVQQLPEDVDARGLQHLVDETGERGAAGSLGQQQELLLALPRHLPLGRHPAAAVAAGDSAPPRWRPAGPGPAAGRHLQPAPRPLLYGGDVADRPLPGVTPRGQSGGAPPGGGGPLGRGGAGRGGPGGPAGSSRSWPGVPVPASRRWAPRSSGPGQSLVSTPRPPAGGERC